MTVSQVNFMGSPSVMPRQPNLELRSKKTWAVLAALVLPAPLTTCHAPTRVLRRVLAERLWSDKDLTDPLINLRQSVHSLQRAFSGCFLADHNTIQVIPGKFVSDIEQMLAAYQKSLTCSSLEERLDLLSEAESKIGGQFLEGCISEMDHAYAWWLERREEVNGNIVMVLLALAKALKEAAHSKAALDIVHKALEFRPDHAEARNLAWSLAVETGQEKTFHFLETIEDFEQAITRLKEEREKSLSIKDKGAFAVLMEAKLQSVEEKYRTPFLYLSVFPGSFSVELAEQICNVSPSTLKALARTRLVERKGKEFWLWDVVKGYARSNVPLATRRQHKSELAQHYRKAMTTTTPPENVLPAALGSVEKERPFLLLTLEWVLKQKPTITNVSFINMLRHCGLCDLAQLALPYLQQVYETPTQPNRLRLFAALFASYILMQMGEHQRAIPSLEMVLPIAPFTSELVQGEDSEIYWPATLYTTLMMSCNAAGSYEKAKEYGHKALKICRSGGWEKEAVHCLRILGEINHHEGNFEQALSLCNAALARRRKEQFSDNDLPDALYWHARILYSLKRYHDAADSVEEALWLWQKAGHTKMGLCLCLMGQLRAAEGRFAEACAHVEHARYLHERAGSEINQMEAIETLGDILIAANQFAQGVQQYQECLHYYQAYQHVHRTQRVREKLTLLES